MAGGELALSQSLFFLFDKSVLEIAEPLMTELSSCTSSQTYLSDRTICYIILPVC